MAILAGFPAYFIAFLHDISAVPHIYYAVVIAVFFGIATASRPGLVIVPVIAAIVYIAALVLGPVLINNAKLIVPEFDVALAKQLLATYIVFLVADTVVYIVKKYALRVID